MEFQERHESINNDLNQTKNELRQNLSGNQNDPFLLDLLENVVLEENEIEELILQRKYRFNFNKFGL